MIEILSAALEATKDLGTKIFDGKFMQDITPDFLKNPETPEYYQIEAAAHSACNFFDMKDIPLQEGDSIGVYTFNPDRIDDDVFQYNKEQFLEMNLTSFEDQTKVWTHECGHRILQKKFSSCWAGELGADFFVGVRSEILGIGSGNFEKTLGKTEASKTHPGGALRLKAIQYGREVVTKMKKEGIQPTWENCIEEFRKSDFAKYDYSSYVERGTQISFQSSVHWTPSEIKSKINEAQSKIEYYKAKISHLEHELTQYKDPIKISSIGHSISGFKSELEKWQKEKRKWENMR